MDFCTLCGGTGHKAKDCPWRFAGYLAPPMKYRFTVVPAHPLPEL